MRRWPTTAAVVVSLAGCGGGGHTQPLSLEAPVPVNMHVVEAMRRVEAKAPPACRHNPASAPRRCRAIVRELVHLIGELCPAGYSLAAGQNAVCVRRKA